MYKLMHFIIAHFIPILVVKNECICRKPSPKMIFDAAKDFNINLSKSYFIGDSASDIKQENQQI